LIKVTFLFIAHSKARLFVGSWRGKVKNKRDKTSTNQYSQGPWEEWEEGEGEGEGLDRKARIGKRRREGAPLMPILIRT
jgi:hypothetical protein